MPQQASDYTNDARIVSVEARTVSIPLDNPTAFSTRQVLARDYTLVRVRTADGHQGIGFCYGGSRAGVLVTHAVRELFRATLVGQSALRVEGLWQDMYRDSL
ncbi:MAG: mandelate racemase/muconate lactonizing enzyme family protein, partial [Massilia sp.]